MGGIAGRYAGKSTNHGLLGTVGGAILGSITQDKLKKKPGHSSSHHSGSHYSGSHSGHSSHGGSHHGSSAGGLSQLGSLFGKK
jgi:small subunit ribosomal protein S2